MSEATPFPGTRRVVTSHNTDGKAIILHESVIQPASTNHGPYHHSIWASESCPADLGIKEDAALKVKSVTNDGTVIRIVDFPPNSTGKLHRSVSLDYVYVIKGEIVLALDDGSRTTLRENEVVVQQGTMHSWDNESNEWTRLLCVLVVANKVRIGDKELGEEVSF